MPAATWWHCACARASAPSPPPPSSPPPHLQLRDIPASALSPLFFCCSACDARLVPCESCHVLLDASVAPDGPLLCCRRCGTLSMLDATLRALLGIAPASRTLLKRVPFVIEPVAKLRERARECDARLQRAREASGGGDTELQAATQPVDSEQRKRKRAEDAERPTPSAEPAADSVQDAPSPPQELMALAALEADAAAAQRQLRDEMRRWEQFAAETTDPSALLLHQQQLQHQSFSATHLSILKVMYDKSLEKAELAALSDQIEQFLQHQPALLKMKVDVLAAVDACREAEQLHAPVFQDPAGQSATVSAAKVAAVIVNSTTAQLRHRYDAFQALSRPHLALVGTANTHLFALYSAAQSLQRPGQGSEREPAIQPELFGGRGEQEPAGLAAARSRRRFSSGAGVAAASAAVYSGGGGGFEQSLALGNRLAEVSKKVELWRALSATIAATCVLSVLELASVAGTPLA